jgi:hypothetical protein
MQASFRSFGTFQAFVPLRQELAVEATNNPSMTFEVNKIQNWLTL